VGQPDTAHSAGSDRGYIQFAAEIEPPRHPGPAARRSRRVRELLEMLEFFAWHLAGENDARAVRIFDAVAFPPGGAVSLAGGQASRAPHYDIALLVQ